MSKLPGLFAGGCRKCGIFFVKTESSTAMPLEGVSVWAVCSEGEFSGWHYLLSQKHSALKGDLVWFRTRFLKLFDLLIISES